VEVEGKWRGSGGGIPIKIRVMISCPSISTPSSKQQGNMSCRINTKSKHQTRMQAWLGKMDRNETSLEMKLTST